MTQASLAKGTALILSDLEPPGVCYGPSHMAFQAEPGEIDRIKANLIERDVAIEAQIDWPGGGHSIYCRDPAGNSVEFATRSLWFEEASKLEA